MLTHYGKLILGTLATARLWLIKLHLITPVVLVPAAFYCKHAQICCEIINLRSWPSFIQLRTYLSFAQSVHISDPLVECSTVHANYANGNSIMDVRV